MNKNLNQIFAKTKILCTVGPATSSPDKIKELVQKGADGIRMNFSHGDYDFFSNVFKAIKEVCKEEETSVSVLIDLQGPKIRIGELEDKEFEIKTEDKIEITINDIKGNKNIISTSYKQLVSDSNIGEIILIDDGLIKLKIVEKKENSVICKVENGGTIRPKKGMNLPGMQLTTQSVTKKDLNDLEFALQNRVDYIALSFVRKASDIKDLRKWLNERNFEKPIIAKIEKKEGVDNFDEILEAADGIMVARGDLGVEMHPQDVPVIQKEIIKKCNAVGKLVITATQMLESMINNPIPTRAEASDVANAVWDGTDVVMLSGETSIGKFPNKSVEVMNDIIKMAEQHLIPRKGTDFKVPVDVGENLFDSVGRAVCSISKQINACVIAAFTFQGRTAINISKFRPDAKIIAFSNSRDTITNLCLRWGVESYYFEDIDKEHMAIDKVKNILLEAGEVKEGDIVIFTAGAPYSEKSRASWIKFEII